MIDHLVHCSALSRKDTQEGNNMRSSYAELKPIATPCNPRIAKLKVRLI
jgi:hypothetical protein